MQRQPSVDIFALDLSVRLLADECSIAREVTMELLRQQASASLIDVSNRLSFVAQQLVEIHARIAGLVEEST